MNGLQASFDDIPPFIRHSDTSRRAAIELVGKEAKLALVRDWIRACDVTGCTDEEGYTALGMNPSTYRPRRIDLVDKYGVVVDSGRRRLTASGRSAVVWVYQA
jgi:hypothetical protein